MRYQIHRRTFLGLIAAAAASAAARPQLAAAAPLSSTSTGASDLTVTQTADGNVFIGSEQPAFSIATSGDSVLWSVYDHWGAQVGSGRESVNQSAALHVPVPGPGHYRLEVAAERQGAPVATAQTTFAVLPPIDLSHVSESAFGVNTHFGQTWPPGLIPLLAKAGIKNVRDEIRWADVEPIQGTYVFPAPVTSYMRDLRDSNVDPLIIFDYINSSYDNNATPYTDAGRAGFADYAAAVVRQFGRQIKWAEVYNEFNLPYAGDRGNGPANARADYYFPLLKATYEQVKATNPEIQVVGPVTNGVPLDWLRELFELGGLQYLDVVSVHLYPLPDPPEEVAQSLAQLQQLIRQYNGGHPKPVWVTEQGWPTYSGPTGVSPSRQAAYLVRAAAVAVTQGVDKYFWYDFMNDGLNDTQPHNQGLVANTGDPMGAWSPKPSYVSYGTLIRQLTGATYVGQDKAGAGITSLVFRRGAEHIRLIWSAEPKTVALFASESVVVTDLVGGSGSYSPSQGRVYLSASRDPIYVVGGVDRAVADGRFVLAGASGGTAFVQDPIQLSLTVDNTASPRSPVEGVFQVAGTSTPVSVPAGTRRVISITLPPETRIGTRTFVGQLVASNVPVARLAADVSVRHPLTLDARHVLKDGADVLTVTVSNAGSRTLAVGGLAWQIGDETGTAAIATQVSAGSSRTVDISLGGLAASKTYAMRLQLPVPGYPDLTLSGAVTVVDHSSLVSVPRKTIVVDGTVDDLNGVPGVDLATDGSVGTVPGFTYGGTDDLSGNVWLTWDDERLYVTARIHDNRHYQPYSGWQLWMGDSIQLAMAPGLPGESQDWYLATLGLGSRGPELYFTHGSDAEVPVGPLSNASIAVSRDELRKDTTYELAIPWTDLPPFQPRDRLLSVAFAVSDNDGSGRNEWMTWGGGITHGASQARKPTLFRAAFLDG